MASVLILFHLHFSERFPFKFYPDGLMHGSGHDSISHGLAGNGIRTSKLYRISFEQIFHTPIGALHKQNVY